MTILFIFAHPDDESYGPAGTIAKLANNHEVVVISLCNGARPGNEQVADLRTDAFIKACQLLGSKYEIYSTPDCALEYDSTLKTIETLINHYQPSIVYTHNISDIHRDHRLVAECCMVACRPKPNSPVNELYFCEMPSSTAWSFNQLTPNFEPNVYNDIGEYIDIKKQVMTLYSTEIYNFPDARSIEAMETLAKYRGYTIGFRYAEAFKLIFSK